MWSMVFSRYCLLFLCSHLTKSSTWCFVGMHGAGLAHSLYMPPGGVLIEFDTEFGHGNINLKNAAKHLGISPLSSFLGGVLTLP
jgi:hypothetical protein